MEANVETGIDQPKTIEERLEAVQFCYKKLRVSFPAIVDNMDDRASADYAAWPARLYIVDKNGKIAYKGRKGPKSFKPLEMAEALSKLLSTSD